MNNRLTIFGTSERPAVYSAEGSVERFSERILGKFERVIKAPAGLSAEEVKASMEHGVLRIELPKEVAKPPATRITIS